MSQVAMMNEVDDGVLGLACFLIRDSSEIKNFHVNEGCSHAHGTNMDLHEGFLEHVCKQVPVFLCERSCSQPVLEACAADEERVNDYSKNDENMTDPLALFVNNDEERYE